MKKFAFLLAIFVFSPVSLFAQNNLAPLILERMQRHRAALRTLQADVTLNKFSVRFGGTFAKDGIIKFVPQKNDYSIRFDSTKPESEILLIIKGQYLLYQPAMKNAFTGSATDSHKSLFFLLSDLSDEKLKADFYIKYLDQVKIGGTIAAWHLELTPKTEKGYKTIELWVDGNGMPLQSKLVETNGDWTTVLLSNLRKNITINAADFRINLPKDTTIVKN